MHNTPKNDLVGNLTDRSFWYRILSMVLFGLVFYFVETAVFVLAIFQVIYKALTGEVHQQVLSVSRDLALYINQLVNYLLFNSEEQPFPIGEWPSATPPTHSPSQGGATPRAADHRAGARTTVEDADQP